MYPTVSGSSLLGSGRERAHEATLFFVVAGIGLLINQVPLVVSNYIFHLRTPHVSLVVENFADFISATIVGTLLATVFRWWAMRKFVFPELALPESAPANELSIE